MLAVLSVGKASVRHCPSAPTTYFLSLTMLSIERIKEILNNPTLSDREAAQIRDELRYLAELLFDQWEYEENQRREQQGLLQQEEDV
jgi:hypothetical protein